MTPQPFADALARALAALIVMLLVITALYAPAEPVRFTPIIDVAALFDVAAEVLR